MKSFKVMAVIHLLLGLKLAIGMIGCFFFSILRKLSGVSAGHRSLEENSFKSGKQGPKIARFNFVSRCPCPERVLGVKPHSDGSTITYLLPDNEVDGLQILKGDQWYKVSVVPGALLINLGELGEAMTNGVFKSVVHRVSTNSVKDRMSVAMFFSPDDEEIKPLSGLVSADQRQLYKNINMNEYMQKLNESFRLGSRAIDAFQV